MPVPVHPGRILKRELQARELNASRFAHLLNVSTGRIIDILNGKRSISADTALRLGRYFGNSPQFWMNLQTQYNLAIAEQERGEEIAQHVAVAK